MILLEGADLLGKTTAAHKLVKMATDKKEPLSYLKLGRESHDKFTFDYFRSRIANYMVCDRGHLSNLIYSRVYDSVPTQLVNDWREFDKIEQMIKAFGGFTIIFFALPDDYEKIVKATWRDDEDFDVDTCMRVNQEYFNLIRSQEMRFENVEVSLVRNYTNFMFLQVHFNDELGEVVYPSDTELSVMLADYLKRQGSN